MRLDRPTHVLKSNQASMWMSDFTEEISGQIAAGINRLGDGEYTFYSIYPLPPDAEYDETVYSYEWIQTAGVAPDRLTVEIRRLDADGSYRVYTIGHPQAADESAATEPIRNGDNTYQVRPAEVLSTSEAIELFQHYYDTHGVPAGWHLREQPEFTEAPAVASTGSVTMSGGSSSAGRPVAAPAQSEAASHGVDEGASEKRAGEGT